MVGKWKSKNKQSLNEMVRKNEQEIDRLENYIKNFYSTEEDIRRMETRMQSLEVENERLKKIVPSDLSPTEIIRLTKSLLPAQEHNKKKQGSLVKISFVDKTAPADYKQRKAIWKLMASGWEYDRCE